MIYYLKTDLNDKPVGLIRQGRRLERLSEAGWVETGSVEWTGIGGDASWDAIGESEALDAALQMGHTEARFRSGS